MTGPDKGDLTRLASHTAGSVLSIYLRTDPRDPANTGDTPGWLVAARNGLREAVRAVEDSGDRDERLTVRDLTDDVASRLAGGLDPRERGRGVAWFVSADGSLDVRFTLQLPPREDAVVWDARPFVSPLVDVADRGQRSGLVLVGGERVRLLSWELGRVEEPERSTYELELGDWRPYAAYAASNPARAQQTATHADHYQNRVERHRERFLDDAAEGVAGRLPALGWSRVLVTGEQAAAGRFVEALPSPAAELVAAQLDLNLDGLAPAAVADRLEPEMERLWRRSTERLVGVVRARASAAAGAAWGSDETLRALVEARVAHLLFDPEHDFAGEGAPAELLPEEADSALLVERAVERAIATGAAVTALPPASPPALADAGGMAALLRY